MIKSVTINGFRGLENLTIPLSSVTMLTGTNGVGKTSVLEGLYCLFSNSKLDVAPLSRYNKSKGINAPQSVNNNLGFTIRNNYNYKLFWDECPSYGKTSCSVSAITDNKMSWSWNYRKAKLHEVNQKLRAEKPIPVDASSEFALWDWQMKGIVYDKITRQNRSVNNQYYTAQILSSDGGLYLFPLLTGVLSICEYIEFTSTRLQPQKLTFQTSKQLTKALKTINTHITDVRLKDHESGLSVVLDDVTEVSLGSIGNGAVTWASVLMAILDIVEINKQLNDIPTLILIDEMGAGIHYSVMSNVWTFLREYIRDNSNIQFVFTSHSADCIRSFCEVFYEQDDAAVVRLHRSSEGEKIFPTEYKKDAFTNIIDGLWEVRG